jgi:hypothetical protein
MWDFEIGGIKQIENWLDSRKYGINKKDTIPRSLTIDELSWILKIISSIKLTLEIVPSLDPLYEQVEQDLHSFSDLADVNKKPDYENLLKFMKK